MKKLHFLIFGLVLFLFSCKKDETIVTGFVRDSISNQGIANARVGVFEMSSNFTANSYQLVKETFTDNNGKYSISVEKPVELLFAAKKGYFDEVDTQGRKITPNTTNNLDIALAPGCKVNFRLVNKSDWYKICLFVPFGNSECEFDYSSECYYDVIGEIATSCYIKAGDTSKISFSYFENINNAFPIKKDTLVYLPYNGELNLTHFY